MTHLPKVLFAGPLSDFSGYASAARGYAAALDAGGFRVATRDLIYDGGKREKSPIERQWASRSAEHVRIIFQQTTPNEMEPKAGYFNVGAFCWETDRIPEEWVRQLNRMDLILVPCEANLKAAQKSGVLTPIEKVPYAFDVSRYRKKTNPFALPGGQGAFNILAICQYSKKKGVDPLLKAYLSEFRPEDNALLTLKTYFGPNDGEEERNRMVGMINTVKQALRLKTYPRIQLINEVMSFKDIDRLYASADLYCLPSRGEGWGVPHFDALGFGLPAIATKGTAPEEFIVDGENGWLVNSHASPCIDMPHPHDFMYTARDNWCEPQVGDLMSKMRRAHTLYSRNRPAWDAMCSKAADSVKNFDIAAVGPQLRDVIMRYYRMWSRANVA
jgi:glycosyltransferase involved in cell wall biosynthesis